MFLDESGDHNLSTIDPQYPLFVLGGVIVDNRYAENEVAERLRSFKRKILGNEEIVLHTADIARNRNGFERMKDTEFRHNFFEELNSVMRDLEYKVAACVVRKEKHLAQYGVAALDPYLLSLDVVTEFLCLEVGNVDSGGMIVAEKRNPTLDRQLDLAWLNLKIQGTRSMQARQIEKRIVGLSLRGKHAGVAGLELADLVVSPIGRHVLGKKDRDDFRIVEAKFRRRPDGGYEGYGLVVLPY